MSGDELLEYAELAVKLAEKMGASEAEAFATRVRGFYVTLKNNNLDQASSYDEAGLGLRVIVDRRVGFSYTSILDKEAVERLAERAVKLARASRPDPEWRGLPEAPSSYPDVEDTYSDRITRVTSSEVVGFTVDMLEEALLDKRITVVYGSYFAGTGWKAIHNSHGIHATSSGTESLAWVEVVASENGDTTPGCAAWAGSRTELVDGKAVVKEAVERALGSLKPVRVESGEMPVIFTEKALFMLFNFSLHQALKGDNVVRGKSPYAGRLGGEVASEIFTVKDRGLMPGGLATERFDDEGVPMRDKTLIEAGVLKGFLYDTYWARKAGTESTGNALRGGYSAIPVIRYTNLVVEPGDASRDEMLAETRRGLLVDDLQGAHSTNPETGEFSVVATPAWLVEGGELRPVRGVMLAGNVYELLKELDMVGREVRSLGHFYSPWLRFSRVRVVYK